MEKNIKINNLSKKITKIHSSPPKKIYAVSLKNDTNAQKSRLWHVLHRFL